MTEERYTEISGKVVKAENEVKAACKQFGKALEEIFKEVSKEDMAKWLKTAKEDDNISGPAFDAAVAAWHETHKNDTTGLSAEEALLLLAALKILG